MGKTYGLQMKSSIFTPSDDISILAFFHNLKAACDSHGKPQKATMWLFFYFSKELTKATLTYRMSAIEDNMTHMDED